MQTYPVNFHDWHGHAYRDGGHWLVAPKHLSDHLSLKWSSQLDKIKGSNLAKGILLRGIPSARGMQETVTLKLPFLGAWVLSIREGNVSPQKRELLAAMQSSLLDALNRQLAAMFDLPGMLEAEDFERLPLPPYALSMMSPDEVRAERAKVLAEPQAFAATRLMRVGLAASRTAPLVNWSVYRARRHMGHCRRIGLVPLTPRDQRLLEQPSLFGEA
jgi:hypothetical protein